MLSIKSLLRRRQPQPAPPTAEDQATQLARRITNGSFEETFDLWWGSRVDPTFKLAAEGFMLEMVQAPIECLAGAMLWYKQIHGKIHDKEGYSAFLTRDFGTELLKARHRAAELAFGFADTIDDITAVFAHCSSTVALSEVQKAALKKWEECSARELSEAKSVVEYHRVWQRAPGVKNTIYIASSARDTAYESSVAAEAREKLEAALSNKFERVKDAAAASEEGRIDGYVEIEGLNGFVPSDGNCRRTFEALKLKLLYSSSA